MEVALLQLFNPFLIPLFLITVLLLRWFKSDGKSKLPPSPPKFPLIGNLHQLGTLPHRSLKTLSEKYGPLMHLQLGQVPTLVISSADFYKEMIKTHDFVFANKPKLKAADILLYGCQDMAFCPYGEYWRQARKICTLGLLSSKKVQEFQFVREEEVMLLVNNLQKACVSGCGSVNISDMLITTGTNIVSRCVLGKKCLEGDSSGRKFGELSRRLEELLMAFCVGDFFPYLGWIDVLRGFIRELKTTFVAFDDYFGNVIEEHKVLRTDGHETDGHEDFVDSLLQLQKDNMFEFEVTEVFMKAILLDMFVGGTDTSSSTLEWLMAELMRNPRVMKKAQEEVRRVVGKKAKIDMNDINQMDYLKCVIKEVLRMHLAAPLLVPRETSKNIEIGAYHIPAKTRVIINAWAIHRDPTLWDRPDEFFPERFENNPIDYKGQDFQFVPFGSGRRGCPGLAFGIASVEYVIANLLCLFDWKLPGDTTLGDRVREDLDMSEIYGLVTLKKIPLHLVPLPYSC